MDDNSKLISRFLEYEKKLQLESEKVRNFPIWFFIREIVFLYGISEEAGSNFNQFDKVGSKKFKSNIPILIRFFYFSFRSFLKLLTVKKTSILVLSTNWSRRKQNTVFHDVYYDRLLDLCSNSKRSTLNLELPNFSNQLHFDRNYFQKRIVYGDLFYFLEILPIKRKKVNKEEIRKVKHFVQSVLGSFEDFLKLSPTVTLSLTSKLENIILRNVRRITIIEKFARRVSPEVLLLTSAYSPMMRIFINSCKKQGAKVVEFQHSHIYPDHIGYNYTKDWLKSKEVLPIPDKVFTYGNFYQKDLIGNRNWPQENVKVVGNPLLAELSAKEDYNSNRPLKELKANYKYIFLIVSQHSITHKLANFIIEHQKHSDILFVIKTHPRGQAELAIYNEKLDTNNSNLLVCSNNKLTDYLLDADVVIGSYSSGLLEAIQMGIQTCVINIPESKFFSNLVNQELITLVSSLDDIINNIDSNIYDSVKPDYKNILNEKYSEEEAFMIIEKMIP